MVSIEGCHFCKQICNNKVLITLTLLIFRSFGIILHRKHMDRPEDKECTEGVGSFLCPIFFSISFSFFPWREKKEIKMFTWWCLKTNCKGTVVSKLGKEQLVKAHRNCLGFSFSTVHSGQKIRRVFLKVS